MFCTKQNIKFLFFSIILLIGTNLYAQEEIDTDSLFVVAKQLSKEDKDEEAQILCREILKINPDNNDVRFYLGLMYSWDKKYDSARKEIDLVLKDRPTSLETMKARLNVEFWSDNPEKALSLVNEFLIKVPDNEELLYLKAKALDDLGRDKEAIEILDKLIEKNPENEDAIKLKNSIIYENQKNKITVGYTYDAFDTRDPWNWSSISYKRGTKKIGSVIGRLNFADRFDRQGYQFEVDAYPSISKKMYLYLNAGLSKGILYPEYRFGGDLNTKLPKAFEASIGMRYLNFSSSDVYIYTGHIGKYIGNFWLSLRPFIVPYVSNFSGSGIFTIRRYFSDEENYIGIHLGMGSSPDDDTRAFGSPEDFRLTSKKVKVEWNKSFSKFWIFSTSVAISEEEYRKDSYLEKYSFDISLARIF